MTETICGECGLSVYSEAHLRGVGPSGESLHGHESTSDEEADAQREDVMARALAFAEAVEAGEAPKRPPRRR
jgi:hypothetical protein